MTGSIRQRKLHQQGPVIPGLRRIGLNSEEFLQRITGKYHLLTRRGGFPARFLLINHRETPLPPAQYQAPSYIINSYNIQLQGIDAAGSSIYGPRSILYNRSSLVYRINLTNRDSFTLRNSLANRDSFTRRDSFTHESILARGSRPAQKYIWSGKNPPEAAVGSAGSPAAVFAPGCNTAAKPEKASRLRYPRISARSPAPARRGMLLERDWHENRLFDRAVPRHIYAGVSTSSRTATLCGRAAPRHIYAGVSISSPRSILHNKSSLLYSNSLTHRDSFTNSAGFTHRNSFTRRDSFTHENILTRGSRPAQKNSLHRKILTSRNIFDYINSLDNKSGFKQREFSGAGRLPGYPGYSGVFNHGSSLSRETAVYPDRVSFQREEYLRTILNRQVKPAALKQAGGAAAYPQFRMHVAAAPGPGAFKSKAPGRKQAAPGDGLQQVMPAQPGSRQTPEEVIAARPDLRQAAAVDVKGLADQVYQVLERKIRIERERRGM